MTADFASGGVVRAERRAGAPRRGAVLRCAVLGLRRALSQPRAILLLWLANVLFALPAAIAVQQMLDGSFGESLVAERMARGFDLDWYVEHAVEAEGLAATFRPSLIGPGPVIENLEAWWSGDLVFGYRPFYALALSYLLLSAFLLGGVLDRLARPAAASGRFLESFLRAGGRYFPRLVALALVSAVFYVGVYLLGIELYRAVEEAAREVTEERRVLLALALMAALVIALLHLVRMVFDYAKVALVLGRGRSVPRSLACALRFLLRRPLPAIGVSLTLSLLAGALFALYAFAAPGVGPSSLPGVVLAFVFAQLYLAARLALRVALLAGEMEIYRAETRE